MGKTPSTVNGSGGSSSKRSAFTKALHHIRMKNGIQLAHNTTTNARKSKKGAVYSRCAPSIASDILLSIDDEERLKLIEDMGFKGLKYLKLTKTNKDYGAWLLSKFDPIQCAFHSGTRSELKVRDQYVNHVLGIPWLGKEIVPASPLEVVTMKKYLCNVFEKESFGQITYPFLTKILYKRPDGPMSAEDIIKFKTAFIMVLVTIFLGPVSLNNHISTRYMTALVDIENVHTYNWAKFVIDELRVAADTLQNKLKNGKAAGYLNGCIIFLQVLYLDNIENGANNPDEIIFPRIRAYDDSIMAELIKKDMVIQNRYPFPSYGKLKIRDRRLVCYSNNTSVEEVEIMKTNPQANLSYDIPGFDLGLSQLPDDNTMLESPPRCQDHGNLVQQFDDAADTKIMKTNPQANLSFDIPSFDLGLSQLAEDNTMLESPPRCQVHGNLVQQFNEVADTEVVPDTPTSGQVLHNTGGKYNPIIIVSPHSIVKEVSNVRILFRENYAGVQIPAKSKKRIMGQASDLLLDIPARIIKPSKLLKSPFLCNKHNLLRNDVKALDELFKYTTSISDNDSKRKIWVHLSNPVPMRLQLARIQEALQIDKYMDLDTFNVAVHALHEDEIHTFGSTEFIGWRHFLNQDFAMYALADDGNWNPEDHIHFFTDDTFIPYDVLGCRLIFIPVHQVAHFSLYAFDMENKVVTILDPVKDTSMVGPDMEQRHAKIKRQVSKALQECLSLAFPDWNEQIPSWEVKFPTTKLPECSEDDSAFQVLHYMRNWDGTRLVNSVPLESVTMRKEFLMTLLSFKNNEAILPEDVQRIIKAGSRR